MIQDRASWNAREPREIPVQTTVVELFLHHSVGSGMRDKDGDGDLGDDYMRTMQNFHMDIRGWNDIAYNHAHDPDGGEFYEGRGFGIRPGAQCRHNTGTHSLVVMGDFRRRTVTPQLIDSIARFYHSQQVAGKLPRVTVQGHRDAPLTGDCTGTTCPGDNLYRALPAINRRINQLHEGDMSQNGPENWDAADLAVIKSLVSDVVWRHWLTDPEGVPPGVSGNPYDRPALHSNTVIRHIRHDTALIPGIDTEGLSEAELDERVNRIVERINAQPAAFIAKLKSKL